MGPGLFTHYVCAVSIRAHQRRGASCPGSPGRGRFFSSVPPSAAVTPCRGSILRGEGA